MLRTTITGLIPLCLNFYNNLKFVINTGFFGNLVHLLEGKIIFTIQLKIYIFIENL